MRRVAGWAPEAGLSPGVDRFGNLGRCRPPTRGALVTAGSHVDTVPDGGRYDGALGTVLGLELAQTVPGCGLMICAAEEAPRFGAGTVGSRLLAGSLAIADLAGLHDAAGSRRATPWPGSWASSPTCRGSSRPWTAGARTPRSTSPSAGH